MKKVKLILGVISIGMLFASCGSDTHENHEGHDDHSMMKNYEGHDHDMEESNELKLNDGKKWKINQEMMVHIDDMKTQVSKFSKGNKKDYAALGKSLTENTNLLTSSCTMTGESHNELHKWLHPYIEIVGELSEAEDEKEAAEELGKIQESITTFNQFFE